MSKLASVKEFPVFRIIDRLLAKVYGDKKWKRRAEPLDELILTVLSQNTNDINRDKAFFNLKKRFPSWKQVLKARTKEVAFVIKPAGLFNQKAPRIKAILKSIISSNEGKLSLNFLNKMPLPDGLAWLQKLPGVGPKTASCVMLFGFGKPAFPVDTHIYRIAKRMGWVDSKVREAKANELLNSIVSDDIKYRLHLNLIAHGRTICMAKKPLCGKCVIRRWCSYYKRSSAKKG